MHGSQPPRGRARPHLLSVEKRLGPARRDCGRLGRVEAAELPGRVGGGVVPGCSVAHGKSEDRRSLCGGFWPRIAPYLK